MQRSTPGPSDYSCHWQGQFSIVADTEPTASGPLAAPAYCETAKQYREVIRNRYHVNPAARQQIQIMARRLADPGYGLPLWVCGPLASEARDILETIAGRALLKVSRSVTRAVRGRRS